MFSLSDVFIASTNALHDTHVWIKNAEGHIYLITMMPVVWIAPERANVGQWFNWYIHFNFVFIELL